MHVVAKAEATTCKDTSIALMRCLPQIAWILRCVYFAGRARSLDSGPWQRYASAQLALAVVWF